MIRNWYNQFPYPALWKKREISKYINWHQFTKCTRGKPNEQLFPRQVVIQLPKYDTHIIGEPKYKYGQHEQVRVRNHNRNTALERSVLNCWGWGGCVGLWGELKSVLRDPNLALSFCYGSLGFCPMIPGTMAIQSPASFFSNTLCVVTLQWNNVV